MIGEGTGISVGVVVICVGALFALWWRIESAIATVRDDLAAFKLKATEQFATPAAIEKTEERLTTSLDRVAGRLEVVAGRVDSVAIELARIAEAIFARQTRGRPKKADHPVGD
jgi:hypothetical protein